MSIHAKQRRYVIDMKIYLTDTNVKPTALT